MKYKIAILGPAYPYRGGISAFGQRLAQELISAGHQVKMVTFTMQYPSILFPGKTQFVQGEAPHNISIVRSLNSISPFSWIKTGRMMRKEKFDIILAQYWIPFMSPSLATALRVATRSGDYSPCVIAIFHNIIPHEKRIGDRLLSNYFVKSVDAFMAMSKVVMDDLSKFDTDKPRYLSPHPLYDQFLPKVSKEEAFKELKLDSGFKYILFFGLVRDYKGLDLLLQAMCDEEIKQKPLKLIIAGEIYSDSQKYISFIEENNMQDRVILHAHFIPDNRVHYYFSAADIVVQPYKSATQSGVTPIIYNYELPMIVTNVGGLPELVPHGKVGYVSEVSSDGIKEAILDFFQKSDLNEFIENIKQEKKRYLWSTFVEKMFSLYQSTQMQKERYIKK